MGFLEALPRWIAGDQNPRWAAIVIVVVTALQAVTAITALLAQPKLSDAADLGPDLSQAYANYAQAAQQYYTAHSQQLQQQPAQAQATMRAEAAAPAQAQQSAAPAQAEQSAAERYALYAEYLNAQQTGSSPAASSPQPGGRTQTVQPASRTGAPSSGPLESTRRSADPPTGSPRQSWPS
jgi:hypothetical protein